MEVITVASIVAYLAMMFTVGRMRGMDINRNIRLFLIGAVAVAALAIGVGALWWFTQGGEIVADAPTGLEVAVALPEGAVVLLDAIAVECHRPQ